MNELFKTKQYFLITDLGFGIFSHQFLKYEVYGKSQPFSFILNILLF